MTYLDKIIEILSDGTIRNTSQIMEELNVPGYKLTYVITALKMGINNGIIIKHENENSKTKYKDHNYSIVI